VKAVIVSSSDELTMVDVPEPVPGPGQVLIDVGVIGVGYVDVTARRGEYPYFPGKGSVPGLEITGQVTAVGPDAPEKLVGQRVLALPAFGGYAEKLVVEADRVFSAPRGIDSVDMVATGLNALVAEIALRRAWIAAGENVLVRGASGGIGVHATQIAHARGAEVAVVTSSAARGERLRALGAAQVVNRTETAVPGGTYDVIVDTVGGPDLAKYLGLLQPNGRYILCGAAGGVPGPESFEPLLRDFQKSPTLFALSLNSVRPDDLRQSWKKIVTLLEEGRLSAVVDQHFPLSEADAALRRVESGKPFGKVILLPR
jgi:NADPH:quinone reductase-like Zn-dependent oxidoreductase